MKWFKKNKFKFNGYIPEIKEMAVEIPAVSMHLDALRLPEFFKQVQSDTIPVINNTGNIIGIVAEYDLAKILPDWSFEDQSYRYSYNVGDIMTKEVWVENKNSNAENLISNLSQMHLRVIPIINENGFYTGYCVTRSTIIEFLTARVKPRSIGGLATPLGIYMTDGRIRAGSGIPGLFATGFVLGIIIIFVQFLTNIILSYFSFMPYIAILLIELSIFIMILRMTPLVKLHAAEHQTIHAIEKGLPLSLETVKMQPRAHKRCGTNIMILLLGIQLVVILSSEVMRFNPYIQFFTLILGFIIVISYWRKFGMWFQQHLTTAKASDKYIKNGIKAGEQLLQRHKEEKNPSPPSTMEKIWNMGIFQIFTSFVLTMWIFNIFLHIL